MWSHHSKAVGSQCSLIPVCLSRLTVCVHNPASEHPYTRLQSTGHACLPSVFVSWTSAQMINALHVDSRAKHAKRSRRRTRRCARLTRLCGPWRPPRAVSPQWCADEASMVAQKLLRLLLAASCVRELSQPCMLERQLGGRGALPECAAPTTARHSCFSLFHR